MTAILRRHVLFDLDGTLVDTRAAVMECYRRVFRTHLDADFPPTSIAAGELFAMRPQELFHKVAPQKAAELLASYQRFYPLCTDFIKVFAGIGDLIRGLAEQGRKPSVVTNKGLERTLIDLGVAGIPAEAFAAIVTAEDTIERKPHPAPILLGLERAGAVADDAVYVGDGPQDILAARASGMPVIAVSYGFYSHADLALHKPTALVDSVGGLADALGLGERARAAS